MTHWWTGKNLCLIQVWTDIVKRMNLYPGSSDDTPVNTVWVENHKTTITPQTRTISLRLGTLSFGEENYQVLSQIIGHPLNLIRVCHENIPGKNIPGKIMIIGRWSSNSVLRYIRIQVSNLIKGISDLLVSTRDFYTTPKAKVIY